MTDRAAVGICLDLDALVSPPLMLMVASAADVVEEIDVLTRATESGELPFERSLRLRCRILQDVPVSEARRRIAVASLDDAIVRTFTETGALCRLVTSLPDCWVADLVADLDVELSASEAQVEGDRLVGIDVLDARAVVASMRERCETVFAVGRAVSDLALLEAADVRVAFGSDPAPAVRDLADYWVTSGRALWQLLTPL